MRSTNSLTRTTPEMLPLPQDMILLHVAAITRLLREVAAPDYIIPDGICWKIDRETGEPTGVWASGWIGHKGYQRANFRPQMFDSWMVNEGPTIAVQGGVGMSNHWSENTNWQSLEYAATALKSKVEAAYFAGNDQDAGDAHDDLTSAEWRLRQAERKAINDGLL